VVFSHYTLAFKEDHESRQLRVGQPSMPAKNLGSGGVSRPNGHGKIVVKWKQRHCSKSSGNDHDRCRHSQIGKSAHKPKTKDAAKSAV
jgi:hypothetical protein